MITKNIEAPVDAIEVLLEVNREKTMYIRMLISGYQNVEQNHNTGLAKTFFENVAEF
jgi:hypothetical protein